MPVFGSALQDRHANIYTLFKSEPSSLHKITHGNRFRFTHPEPEITTHPQYDCIDHSGNATSTFNNRESAFPNATCGHINKPSIKWKRFVNKNTHIAVINLSKK